MKTTSFRPPFCVGSAARTSTGAGEAVAGEASATAWACHWSALWSVVSWLAAAGSALWSVAAFGSAVAAPAASNMKRGSSA
ncbi:hypothetical protein J2848_005929 [Azospirillum lipoferum]|uniref:hypothetical protein n=1 Tax=Azospirillum TaxID=191 RepID=UPI001FEB8778|nr:MULTISPECIES: hypothetical protein [Azospirillum]MCP1614226.1 hypothetical protein [Azospirillum lipoferum]MDW5536911.1 hypothetical protein [Azospirillum sp. NL1]